MGPPRALHCGVSRPAPPASAPRPRPMIHADLRARLDRRDAQLAVRLLAGADGDARVHWERVLADAGLDALLDEPALAAALRRHAPGAHASLPLFCYVVVRHALRAAGEGDRRLADYLASLVVQFGLRDRARRVAEADDEVYDTLAALLAAAEADERQGNARRALLVRAHLGNYALWRSGLFADGVEARRYGRGGPTLDYYEAMGRQGFRMAAEHRLAAEYGLASLFAAAAERFAVLRVALSAVSDALLFPHRHTPERLMRQVRDEARWRLSA